MMMSHGDGIEGGCCLYPTAAAAVVVQDRCSEAQMWEQMNAVASASLGIAKPLLQSWKALVASAVG